MTKSNQNTNTLSIQSNGIQVTDQGSLKITVYFKDKNSDALWSKAVPRAFLSRMYTLRKVVGAIKAIPVIEV